MKNYCSLLIALCALSITHLHYAPPKKIHQKKTIKKERKQKDREEELLLQNATIQNKQQRVKLLLSTLHSLLEILPILDQTYPYIKDNQGKFILPAFITENKSFALAPPGLLTRQQKIQKASLDLPNWTSKRYHDTPFIKSLLLITNQKKQINVTPEQAWYYLNQHENEVEKEIASIFFHYIFTLKIIEIGKSLGDFIDLLPDNQESIVLAFLSVALADILDRAAPNQHVYYFNPHKDLSHKDVVAFKRDSCLPTNYHLICFFISQVLNGLAKLELILEREEIKIQLQQLNLLKEIIHNKRQANVAKKEKANFEEETLPDDETVTADCAQPTIEPVLQESLRYDPRVTQWFSDECLQSRTMRSLLYHRFPQEFDSYLMRLGKKAPFKNQTRPHQKDKSYSLFGEILSAQHTTPTYVQYHITQDPKGIIYHRGLQRRTFENVEAAYTDQNNSAWHVFHEEQHDAAISETKIGDNVSKRKIMQNNPFIIQIRDDSLATTFTLYKIAV